MTDPERTDEEIAAENDGDQVDVALLDRETWRQIVTGRLEVGLLEAIEQVADEAGYDAAAVFLEQHGLGAPLRPPSRE